MGFAVALNSRQLTHDIHMIRRFNVSPNQSRTRARDFVAIAAVVIGSSLLSSLLPVTGRRFICLPSFFAATRLSRQLFSPPVQPHLFQAILRSLHFHDFIDIWRIFVMTVIIRTSERDHSDVGAVNADSERHLPT